MDLKILGITAITLAIFILVVAITPQQQTGATNNNPFAGLDDRNVVGTYTSVREPAIQEIGYVTSAAPMAPRAIYFAGESSTNGSLGQELTVYNQGLGLVKDTRSINVATGLNRINFEDVAKLIDPTSVQITPALWPLQILEQNYEYDLADSTAIMQRYLGKTITVVSNDNTFTGKLLSYANGVVLQTNSGIVTVNDVTNVEYPVLPDGLMVKPTLVWQAMSSQSGSQDVQVSYLTSGISWSADYIATANADGTMTLDGWATINNNAGASFSDATLKLVAGDIHTVSKSAPYRATENAYYDMMAPQAAGASVSQVTSTPIYEYYIYAVNRPTTINDNEVKQIGLLSADGITAEKEYIFDSQQYSWYYDSDTKVKVLLKFNNSDANGLGMSLPAGTISVYMKDAQGSLQFIGEDSIAHTPKDENVTVFTGYATDITAEKTTTESQRVSDNTYRYSYKIVFSNHKDTAVTITDVEHIGSYATVTATSQPYMQKDSSTIEYRVSVPANGQATVTYTVLNSY